MHQIKRAREDAGLTQVRLAKLAGITQQALSQIETGAVTPSVGTLRRLGKVLGLSLQLVPATAAPRAR